MRLLFYHTTSECDSVTFVIVQLNLYCTLHGLIGCIEAYSIV